MADHTQPDFYEKYGFCAEPKSPGFCPECRRLDQEERVAGMSSGEALAEGIVRALRALREDANG